MADDEKPVISEVLKVLAPLAVTAVLIAGFGVYNAVKGNEDQVETDRIALIADQLVPPTTWSMTSDIRAGEHMCSSIEATCNSVDRSYDLPAPITHEEFNALATRVGLDPAHTSGDCLDNPQTISYETFCDNEAIKDGHKLRLSYGSKQADKEPFVRYMVVDLDRHHQ